MLEEPVRQLMKDLIGITDEDLDKISPGQQKMLSVLPEAPNFKIIAEVVDAKYCLAGCKVGDKLVIHPAPLLNTEESTCPLCMAAISQLLGLMYVMIDRFADGRDPNESILSQVQCDDTGLEHGGIGSVFFKVYTEKVKQ
jgi:uncharacterized repeat protein (TIGR04076 family)